MIRIVDNLTTVLARSMDRKDDYSSQSMTSACRETGSAAMTLTDHGDTVRRRHRASRQANHAENAATSRGAVLRPAHCRAGSRTRRRALGTPGAEGLDRPR